MEKLLRRIGSMDYEELQQVMDAVEGRFAQSFPEWEVLYLSVHKAPVQRRQELIWLMDMLERELYILDGFL